MTRGSSGGAWTGRDAGIHRIGEVHRIGAAWRRAAGEAARRRVEGSARGSGVSRTRTRPAPVEHDPCIGRGPGPARRTRLQPRGSGAA